ncbi:MAG: 50S ribosomal protein L25 [Patescibacteria group bacterium]|nr:50S ribosomal protein L25 [Patescibacteria group bacterium]MDE2015422.1 50S ribosomal protein L25 [Patescibacteria group bacterium]MDE2226963.1 50S ribosomal protein L25 [Patescibacteria group bacterium]
MDLTVKTREKFGKAVGALRKQGIIPAELYGRGIENVHLNVAAKDFAKLFKEAGSNTVVNIVVDGKKYPALVHDVSKNYFSGEVDHVDFYAVRMDEKLTAKIPLEFLGDAPAVKDKGGILNKAMYEVEVEALPADLPHSLQVDLSVLDDLNKSIYVKDLKISSKAKIVVDPETVIATVTPPVAEEVKVEEPVDVSTVKVESEEKKAERAAEKNSEDKTEETKKK